MNEKGHLGEKAGGGQHPVVMPYAHLELDQDLLMSYPGRLYQKLGESYTTCFSTGDSS